MKDYGRGPAIWQRQPGGHRKLVYVLKTQTPIPMLWSAESDFRTVVMQEVQTQYPGEMIKAILRA